MKNNTNVMKQMGSRTLSLLMEDLAFMCEKNSVLQKENNALNDLLNDIVPKAKALNELVHNHCTYTTAEIAEECGLTPTQLNDILYKAGVHKSIGRRWVLKEKYAHMGLTKSEDFFCYQLGIFTLNTKWSHLGREFIHTLLEINGLLPVGTEEIGVAKVPNYVYKVIRFIKKHKEWRGTATELMEIIGEFKSSPSNFARTLYKHYTDVLQPNNIEMLRYRVHNGRVIELYAINL